jgi:polar amino acid transport system substrate-binding protein
MIRGFRFLVMVFFVMLLTSCGLTDINLDSQESVNEIEKVVSKITPKRTISDEELSLYSPEIREIFEEGKLKVAFVAKDRKPFFYQDSHGDFTGSDVALARDIASNFGVDIEIIRTAQSFDEVIQQVASGEADMSISKLSATLSRARMVLFTDPYLTLHQGLLMNRLKLAKLNAGQENMLEFIQQSSLTIGVLSGTSYVDYAKSMFPYAEVVEFETSEDLIQSTLRGDIFAAFYDEFELTHFVKNHPEYSIDLKLLIIQDRVDPIAIALPSKNTHLLSWINLYLQNNKAWVDQQLRSYDLILDDREVVK